MGYTHDTLLVTHGKFRKISLVSAVENIISIASLVLWSIGIDLQRHDDGCILLNGAPRGNETEDEDEVSHEGFHLTPEAISFRFCKTARKQYDTVVVACFLAPETIAIDNGFSMRLCSDGNDNYWSDGCILYGTAFPGWMLWIGWFAAT